MRKQRTGSPGRRALPEAGQWPDRLLLPALIASGILLVLGFLLAFFFAGPVNGASVPGVEIIGGQMVANVLLISQKIFYFHMPCAITSMIALIFAAYYAIRYLKSREARFDTCAKTATEVGLVFVLATMATGDLWTRFEWGVWWTWDPKLTTYLILTLIVIGYFVLRAAVEDPERRATFSAVLSIITLVDIPICFMITRLVPSSLHPVVLREGGMTGDMVITLLCCMFGMLLLGFALYRLRFRAHRIDERLKAVSAVLETED